MSLDLIRHSRSLVVAAGLLLGAGPAGWAADWTLAPDASSLSFGSVKADTVGESHRFESFDATVGDDGAFALTIDLASVETGIDIRNQRMREFLFEVAEFSKARLTGTLDLAAYRDLAVGAMAEADLTGTLSLHGMASDIQTAVTVVRLDQNRVGVFPRQIVFINTEAFGLTDGVDKLRQLAGLPSITGAVPVSFNLVFTREG
ncbi:polyisoprenoid-binding protein YceI [Rhodothalassium salexigens DSM 2132]|uniref:Polyisoprenoid-binding protein YceI n=1 Tax=Rhodothalassium salexigens DSM 2132 TaxID=1188247 RepID=A0A4R2PII7_RHOSA|nr:YceI family protein [Rhodothalassium salexigens]MBB4211381.1 polyisoprenoid-binding protein YceI [Rhodothalassium salexigens DSM 2132]TCP35302.1 polyisoprenoid-binding protein YceI [Rhodothalassium salexigens DSM 2132]